MLEDLVKLADYLDRNKKVREANVIDTFITKISQVADQTWQENDEDIIPSLSSQFQKDQDKIKIDENVSLDLKTHPLGQKVSEFIKNVFLVADTGVASTEQEGFITVQQMNDIAETALRYDGNLKQYSSMNENPDPLTPHQMMSILNGAIFNQSITYPTKHSLDTDAVKELAYNLYKIYEEKYLEDYLKLEPSFRPDEQIKTPNTRELSPEESESLWRENLRDVEKARTINQIEQSEKEKHPELSKARRDSRREQMKKQYPEEWHKVLFDE